MSKQKLEATGTIKLSKDATEIITLTEECKEKASIAVIKGDIPKRIANDHGFVCFVLDKKFYLVIAAKISGSNDQMQGCLLIVELGVSFESGVGDDDSATLKVKKTKLTENPRTCWYIATKDFLYGNQQIFQVELSEIKTEDPTVISYKKGEHQHCPESLEEALKIMQANPFQFIF